MFLGWRIVALAFLTNYVSVGFVFYSYGVFFKALAADFGGTRLGVSAGLTSMSVMSAIAAPFVGRLLDRGKARVVMTVGAVLMAAGFVLGSRIGALWQFYLVFGCVMGLGVCMLGGLASSTLVANWFVARRGTALGLAAMGISVSGVLMPPLGTALIASIGWRNTFLCYASLAAFVLAPIVWSFVISSPELVGQLPDGERAAPYSSAPMPAVDGTSAQAAFAPAAKIVDAGPSAREVLRDARFWLIALSIALNFTSLSAVLTHAVPHATDLGVSPQSAALVLSAMAGAGAIGKPLFGALTDRMDKRVTLALCTLLQMAGLALLLEVHQVAHMMFAGALFGLGMGGVVPLQGALVGAAFGRRAFGRVMGLMSPAMVPIQMLGVPFAGFVFDQTGSYTIAFRTFLGAFALSIVAVSRLRLPAVEPGSSLAPSERPAAAA